MPAGSPGYKSDASHLPSSDIEAEDVPTRILHLVEAVIQVRHHPSLMPASESLWSEDLAKNTVPCHC